MYVYACMSIHVSKHVCMSKWIHAQYLVADLIGISTVAIHTYMHAYAYIGDDTPDSYTCIHTHCPIEERCFACIHA